MFSSRSFIVSGLTFRSFIHFEFIFVYGVRKCSSFILLQVIDQFSQHHLLKRLFFFPLHILAASVENKVSIGSWIYLWAFYSVPLTYISVFVPVPYCLADCGFVVEPEVRQVDSSSSILSQDYFVYLRFFVFPYKLSLESLSFYITLFLFIYANEGLIIVLNSSLYIYKLIWLS